MADVYWECPVCGFEARNEEEKKKHTEEMKNDPAHKKADEEMEKKKEY